MHTYLSRTHDSRLRTYTGRPRAPQRPGALSRTHCDTTWGDLWGWAGARTRPRVWLLRTYKSVSHTARPRLVGVPAPRMAHAGWSVCRHREGGRGLEYTYRDAAAGLRARRRGAGARGEGRGQGSGEAPSIRHVRARDRARTQSSAPCSVFSSAPASASRCLALRAHATPQSLPRACSMHRQKYSICEVKQLRTTWYTRAKLETHATHSFWFCSAGVRPPQHPVESDRLCRTERARTATSGGTLAHY